MEFKSVAHKNTYEKVRRFMTEIFGEMCYPKAEAPIISVSRGSAWVQVYVMPWGEDDATITTRSWVVTKVEATADLHKFLLRANYDMRFGAFGIDEEGDIAFEHTIVGSSCDKEEIKASILAVLSTADKYDDIIVSRWGGQRAIDRQ